MRPFFSRRFIKLHKVVWNDRYSFCSCGNTELSNQLSFASAAENSEPLNDVSTSIATLSADYPNNLNIESKSVVSGVNRDVRKFWKLLFILGEPGVYLLV